VTPQYPGAHALKPSYGVCRICSKQVASYELEHAGPDDSGIAVVALTGELDLTNADELVTQLRELANGATSLVVDLNRLVFIDSAAIHNLFQIVEERGRRSIAFVVDPTAAVAGTLQIVALDRVAPVVASLDAARSLLGPETGA
jgi:anti-anti-sigma factor